MGPPVERARVQLRYFSGEKRWFMVDIIILHGGYFMVYKATYNWGGPSCRSTLSFKHWQKVPETSRYHETWNQRSTEDVRQPHKIIDG